MSSWTISRNKIQLASKEECTGCGACEAVCSKHAISLVPNREGFKYPIVNAEICVNCHNCEKICPVIDNNKWNVERDAKGYAFINNDNQIIMRSKSGGAFYTIAKYIIERGGVVFGVKWDDTHIKAKHAYTETLDGLKDFQGSKYVPSDIGTAYHDVKTFLKQGRMVLFSGLPCQIAGLYHFLGTKYENLYTIECICHGVSNDVIFEEYMHWKYPAAVRFLGVNMHNKIEGGWRHPSIFTCVYQDKNGIIHEEKQRTTDCHYLLASTSDDYILRRSCRNCQFKQPHNYGDVVLGDFWGVWDVYPELFDNRGVSIVMTMNSRGEILLVGLRDKGILCEAPLKTLLERQPYATSCPSDTKKVRSNRFFFFFFFRRIFKIFHINNIGWLYKDDYTDYMVRKIKKILKI